MTPTPGRLVLLGHPVRHSLSPVFQNAALRAAGLDLTYEPLDVPPDGLTSVVRDLVARRWAGNVTIPHKIAVFALCARHTDVATRVGAVNTFWVDADGSLVGDNTDVGGFTAAARRVLGEVPRGARVAVLGAGGAAAAVLAALEAWPGARVALYNRGAARRDALAARYRGLIEHVVHTPRDAVRDCTLVVNATSVGLGDDAVPVDLAHVPSDAAVLDLVYREGETAWVREARRRGHRAADGLAMLVEQGALAFERWFDRPAPRDVMWDAVCARA